MFDKLKSFLLDAFEVLIFAVSIFLFIYLLIVQPHKIKGASMEPNFFDGEYLLTNKIGYRLDLPERGDVVVFKAPGTNGDEFIKRIIGLPGEVISIQNNRVFINSKPLNEIYLPESTKTLTGTFLREGKQITIPNEKYFVLGDNRAHSSDSRAWGFVGKDQITGKAWLIYWPPQKAGKVKAVDY